MVVKVFVLGLPGSGKSTTARYIDMIAHDHGWAIIRINDYDILREMFQAEAKTEYKRFRPTQYDGFDVLDLSVFDTALVEIERKVWQRKRLPSVKNELIIIEFARDDYSQALQLFSSDSLQNAYFLFVDADIPTCIQRIRERVVHPTTEDDHFVSEYIFESYYQKDDRQYITSIASNLEADLRYQRIRVIDNTSTRSIRNFLEQVGQLVDFIINQETLIPIAA